MNRLSTTHRNQRSSMVPSMAQVVIDETHPAPESTVPSLDFDRVVNAYSILAVKKRLIHHYNASQKATTTNNTTTTTQQPWSPVKSYSTFRQDFHQQLQHLDLMHSPHGKTYVQWGLTIAVGLICGGLACLLLWGTSSTSSLRTRRLNQQLQQTPNNYTAILLEYILFNLILASLSSLLCILYAPNAVGSGIPEVKAYLNGVAVASFADWPVFVTKLVGTWASVSSGLVVGPEGPLVHLGAIVGQGITKTTQWELRLRQFQQKHNTASRLLGCGNCDSEGYGQHLWQEQDMLTNIRKVQHLFDSSRGDLEDLEEEWEHHEEETEQLLASTDEEPNAEEPSSPEATCPNVNYSFWTETMGVLSRFRNDGDRRDLISIGVATGFSAAFGAPVGGLLYSLEEASTYFTIPLMFRTLVATAVGTFVIALYHGNLSQFSVLSLGDETAEYHKNHSSFLELPLYIFIGAMGGLLGALFNGTYLFINTRRKKFYAHPGRRCKNICRLVEVWCVSMVTSLITFCLPMYIPQNWACADAKEGGRQEALENRFNCPEGQFNEIASIMLGSRDDALNDLLTDPTKFEARTLLLSGLTFLSLMMITFGIYMPTGLFMPTFLTGSTLAGWAGVMIKRYILPTVIPENMALVGATAMLAGVQRTTVSLCIIMMEATGETKVLIPLIIGVVVARYVADWFNEGFYHINMHMKEFPFLEHEIQEAFDVCTVSDVMTSPVLTLNGVEKASVIEQMLLKSPHNAFPVLDQDTKQYVGIIRRDQLVALIECGIYLEELDESQQKRTQSVRAREVMTRAATQHLGRALMEDADSYTSVHMTVRTTANILDKESEWLKDNVVRSDHGKSVVISTDETLPGGNAVTRITGTRVDVDPRGNIVVRVCTHERNSHVDIAAAMNKGAFTVTQNCPLSKAYGLFTSMGLRHLPVLGPDGKVIGLLTRSNFSPGHLERRTGLSFHH